MYKTHNGFLIHTRDYRETSSILNIFTSQGGIESLIFKGKHTNKDRFRFSIFNEYSFCLLYTSPSPRDTILSRMPSSA